MGQEHTYDLRGIFNDRELEALAIGLMEVDALDGEDCGVEYHEFAADFKLYKHPRFTMVVAPDEVACYEVTNEDFGRELVEPDAVKTNDDGWRIYVYKHLADKVHAFMLAERVGFAGFEEGRLTYAEHFHIQRND